VKIFTDLNKILNLKYSHRALWAILNNRYPLFGLETLLPELPEDDDDELDELLLLLDEGE